MTAPRYNGHPCCGKPEQSVMLCGDIHALEGEDLGILLRETLKLSFVHVQKKSHVGYAHVHTSMRVIFFHDYKDIILDGPSKTELATLKKPSKISILVCSSTASDAEIIRLIIVSLVTSSGCVQRRPGGSKRKVVYSKPTKPKIITTEEADDRIEAVTHMGGSQ
ncbi:835_t:CDS:2 [Funneliformis geosporum]|nr:835_t:CDS:2 [Funneliformis geosporum]